MLLGFVGLNMIVLNYYYSFKPLRIINQQLAHVSFPTEPQTRRLLFNERSYLRVSV